MCADVRMKEQYIHSSCVNILLLHSMPMSEILCTSRDCERLCRDWCYVFTPIHYRTYLRVALVFQLVRMYTSSIYILYCT